MAHSKDERDAVILAMVHEGHSQRYIADKLGMSKANIARVVKRLKETPLNEYAQAILDKMKADREENQAKMMDLIESSQYYNTVERALLKLDDQAMDNEIEQRGIGNIYKLIGTFIDKATSLQRLRLEREQVMLKTKQLELREKELDLRQTNPEAFHEVHIINDAPSSYGTNPN